MNQSGRNSQTRVEHVESIDLEGYEAMNQIKEFERFKCSKKPNKYPRTQYEEALTYDQRF